jgi:hypothetical protein
MDIPTSGEGSGMKPFSFEDLTGDLQKIQKEFIIPAELLE